MTRREQLKIYKDLAKKASQAGDDKARLIYAVDWMNLATAAEKTRAPQFITKGAR